MSSTEQAKAQRVYVAGHRGLVGSALVRRLQAQGQTVLARTHAELDLTQPDQVEAFFATEKPTQVYLAAAKVGGIVANNTYPAEFIRDNLAIQTNVIHSAWRHGVERLLFLGSSCIYPRECPQPMREEHLLTGPLEPTNRPYALAKIAGIEMCSAYNRQYGTRFLAAMPTNLYGPGDNYNLQNSHVLPALIRKFHEAKLRGDAQVPAWGTGTPLREFLYSDDMADACVYLMDLPNDRFDSLLSVYPPLVNVGCGHDLSIKDLTQLVGEVVGYTGEVVWDTTKPDGTPRKLMDVGRLTGMGWAPKVDLRAGIGLAYADFLKRQAEGAFRD
ncbi:GDP-L-fucose synthase [Curvibacter sp. HBC28]|uniref:GDP-L-fucose synthase n=1 Tax=Curvibacter microcysteis TaxID=3026419 RepID=A0ABT5MDC3_9BURK|nr:GDP-L-fucose synthase [Curvibacter sp. HBC28]MDD0814595.1 GDP-L-fucose synthase [Curvibacter sp. HBC28]